MILKQLNNDNLLSKILKELNKAADKVAMQRCNPEDDPSFEKVILRTFQSIMNDWKLLNITFNHRIRLKILYSMRLTL